MYTIPQLHPAFEGQPCARHASLQASCQAATGQAWKGFAPTMGREVIDVHEYHWIFIGHCWILHKVSLIISLIFELF